MRKGHLNLNLDLNACVYIYYKGLSFDNYLIFEQKEYGRLELSQLIENFG